MKPSFPALLLWVPDRPTWLSGRTPPSPPKPFPPATQPHIAVTVHAQRLDLGGLLLLVFGADGPEQVLRGRLPGRGGRGGGGSPRGTGLHRPAGRHDPARAENSLSFRLPPFSWPLPFRRSHRPTSAGCCFPLVLKEAADTGHSDKGFRSLGFYGSGIHSQ
jgi:hypothetical protein